MASYFEPFMFACTAQAAMFTNCHSHFLMQNQCAVHSCMCVCRLPAAWGVTVCRRSLPFARECRLGVWFGFVGAALLPAVGSCVVLAFGR